VFVANRRITIRPQSRRSTGLRYVSGLRSTVDTIPTLTTPGGQCARRGHATAAVPHPDAPRAVPKFHPRAVPKFGPRAVATSHPTPAALVYSPASASVP
jgi:hypothetical protein